MSVGLDNLLSGAVGAFLVAIFTVVFTENKEARRSVRACMGYARLLDAEIEANRRALEVLEEHSNMPWEEFLALARTRPPSIEVWTQVRTALAPLIKSEQFAVLNDYYRRIGFLLDAKDRPIVDAKEIIERFGIAASRSEGRNWDLDSLAYELKRDTPWVRGALSEYVNPPRRVKWLGF